MTNKQNPSLGVTPENYEWLAETFGHDPAVLEHDWDDLTLSIERATLAAVRAVPNDVASVPLDRSLAGGRIARQVSENVVLGSRLSPTVLYGAQALMNRAGLSSEHRALADVVLNMLHVAGGSAQFEDTTIKQVVRRQTKAWHDQGWTPRTITRGSCAAAVISRPRARGARATRARAVARSSSRSGDSGSDGPGEPDPGDLAGPCCCEQCGNELLLPARLCGLCEEEAGLRHEARACVICGTDISDRRADAETCGAAHKKTLQRRRAQLREPTRLAPQELDHHGSNPLADIASDILACVYRNGTNSPPRHVVPRPWRGERGEVIRVDKPSVPAPAVEPSPPVIDLADLRMARRHARFVNALAAAAGRRMVDRIAVAA